MNVNSTANASDEFEGKGAEVKNAALTSDLERVLIESKCVDLSKLVVVKGTACWNVSVDALVGYCHSFIHSFTDRCISIY
jgi:exosome complex RNA-binding protein Rrp42 (RNase PH superfamily)